MREAIMKNRRRLSPRKSSTPSETRQSKPASLVNRSHRATAHLRGDHRHRHRARVRSHPGGLTRSSRCLGGFNSVHRLIKTSQSSDPLEDFDPRLPLIIGGRGHFVATVSGRSSARIAAPTLSGNPPESVTCNCQLDPRDGPAMPSNG
jgi:hypothetical protein